VSQNFVSVRRSAAGIEHPPEGVFWGSNRAAARGAQALDRRALRKAATFSETVAWPAAKGAAAGRKRGRSERRWHGWELSQAGRATQA